MVSSMVRSERTDITYRFIHDPIKLSIIIESLIHEIHSSQYGLQNIGDTNKT